MEDLKKRIDNFINLHPSECYAIQYVKEMSEDDVTNIYKKYITPIVDFDDENKKRLFNKLEKTSRITYKANNENSRSWYQICRELANILLVDSSEDINILNSVDALVRLKLWEYTNSNILSEYKEYASMIWNIISKDNINFRNKYFIK